MKTISRFVISFLLMFGLMASFTPTLAGDGGGEREDPVLPAALNHMKAPSSAPAAEKAPASLLTAQAAPDAAAALSLGKPGLSYSFAKTYGTKDSFFLADPTHSFINYPTGVFAASDGVWVVEEVGMRAIKYDQNGAWVSQVGEVGHRYFDTGTESFGQISIDFLMDAAVDSSGNLWLTNSQPGNVLKFSPTGELLMMLGKEYNGGPANDRFSSPVGVAFDPAGNLYVGDRWNHRVQVFQANGTYLATIGETEVSGNDDSHFNTPMRLAVDSDSRLYVVDQENHRVQILNVTNPQAPAYVGTLGTTGEIESDNNHFCYPQGVAVDASLIYVADSCNQRVQIFNRVTRAYVATLGTGDRGAGSDAFSEPQDVSVAPDGTIYVADYENHRVQVFNSSRAYVRTLGTTGEPYLTDDAHLNRPAGVAVDSSSNIYVVEDFGQRLVKIGPNGTPVWSRGEAGVYLPEWRKDTAHLRNPRDVAVSPTNGNIYVVNTGNSDIRIYSPSGAYLSTMGTGEGQGNTQFNWPNGIFIAADGKIYVADSGNRRVQIFNANGSYLDTLGVTGDCSSETGKFCSPDDVAVDSKGNIYVAESNNARVQMFNSSHQYVRTLGVLSEHSGDYGYFAGPTYVAVDRSDNVYISSTWDHTVHFYDSQGAFLGVLGSHGDLDSNLANGSGLAFGPDGSLYVADYDNARVARYARGYRNWQQKNISGFGDRWKSATYTMAAYKDHLYVGSNSGQSRLQIMDSTGAWVGDSAGSWGSPSSSVTGLYVYNDKLYATAWVGSDTECLGFTMKRFDGTTWDDIVTGGFEGKSNSCEIDFLQAFNSHLYAVVWMDKDPTTGNPVPSQLWRSPSGNAGTWEKVVDLPMFVGSNYPQDFIAFNDALYIASYNSSGEGGQVWRSTDGITWNPATNNNLGNSQSGYAPMSFASYQGYLYVGVRNYMGTGSQLWRCQTCDSQAGWQQVNGDGFGGVDANGDTFVDNYRIDSFAELGGQLYAAVGNTITGMQVWRTADGLTWLPVAANGFGFSDTRASFMHSSAVFNDQVYFAAANFNLGLQVWAYNKFVYLPALSR